jgi:hypothetical protein
VSRGAFEGVLSSDSTLGHIDLHSALRVSTEVYAGKQVERFELGEPEPKFDFSDISIIECEINLEEIEALKHKEKDGHHAVPFFKESEHDLPGESGGVRELEKSSWGGGAPLKGLEDEDGDWQTDFSGSDQFERNKQFGYKGSTYTDEQYTTKLDQSKVSEKRKSLASKVESSLKKAPAFIPKSDRNEDNDDATEARQLKPTATSFKPGQRARKSSFNPDLSPSKDDVRRI